MADDKSKTSNLDCDKVAGGEDYEVAHLSNEAGISLAQAKELIKAYGYDREVLMRAAKMLPGDGGAHVRSSRV